MEATQREQMYHQLRTELKQYENLFAVSEESGEFSLSTTKPMQVGKIVKENGYFFAGLKEHKNIIGFYFMPIYIVPELLTQVPPPLKKILKGKSCFNLRTLTPDMIADLHRLMQAGITAYKDKGWL